MQVDSAIERMAAEMVLRGRFPSPPAENAAGTYIRLSCEFRSDELNAAAAGRLSIAMDDEEETRF